MTLHIRAPIPVMKAPPLWPNDLLNFPPPNTITLVYQDFSTQIMGGHDPLVHGTWKKGSRNSTSSGGAHAPSWARSWARSLWHLPSASLWLPAWVGAAAGAAIVCGGITLGSDVIWTWKLAAVQIGRCRYKMLLCETSPITSTVFVVQSVRETKEYIVRQLLLISFSFVSLWHDCPFFWIFVSNPKSDSHVVLGLKLKSIRLNFNNHQKKKGKVITTNITYYIWQNEGRRMVN